MKENKIIQGDCLEVMKSIPDNSIDCVITDPPYSGLNSKSKGTGRFSQENTHIEFDDMSERAFLKFVTPIFKTIYKKLKVGGHFYCFTDWKQLRNMMDCIELCSYKVVNVICWDKKHFGTGAGYRSQAEYILVFSKSLPSSFNLKNVGNVLSVKKVYKKEHPHQKPTELLDILIRNSSKENDLILDPFAGSGSTCVAAQNLHRRFIGIELEEKYCSIARDRLKQQTLI